MICLALVVVWLAVGVFGWSLCAAAGRADERLGIK